MKNCAPLWREAHFKMHKTLGVRTTFERCDVEKVHAVAALTFSGVETRQSFKLCTPIPVLCTAHFLDDLRLLKHQQASLTLS